MSNDITVDGMTRVGFLTALANLAAPTTTECNNGILLSPVMTPTGLIGFEVDTADVDNSSLDSTDDTVTIGRDSFSGTMLELKKQFGTDTAYATLTRGTTGFLVLRRDLAAATAWTSGQPVETFPVIFGSAKRITPAKNEVTKYQVPVKVYAPWNLRAAIA